MKNWFNIPTEALGDRVEHLEKFIEEEEDVRIMDVSLVTQQQQEIDTLKREVERLWQAVTGVNSKVHKAQEEQCELTERLAGRSEVRPLKKRT